MAVESGGMCRRQAVVPLVEEDVPVREPRDIVIHVLGL
jgi:hypothetical protein